jgi:hypothetical protein
MSADRVQVLEKLYKQGQGSAVMDLALEKLFTYELHTSQQKLAELKQDLAQFEERYALSSDEFYNRFQAGEMGDAMDFIEWASLFQMVCKLRERIDLLETTS